MLIDKSNIAAFMQTAIGKVQELKDDEGPDDHLYDVGVVVAHAAGVIRALTNGQVVDSDDLSAVFESGAVDVTYEDCIADATKEINSICLTLG